jgi:hypothetical protein
MCVRGVLLLLLVDILVVNFPSVSCSSIDFGCYDWLLHVSSGQVNVSSFCLLSPAHAQALSFVCFPLNGTHYLLSSSTLTHTMTNFTHTRTHSLTYTISFAHTYTHSLYLSLELFLSLSRTLSNSLSRNLSNSLSTNTHTYTTKQTVFKGGEDCRTEAGNGLAREAVAGGRHREGCGSTLVRDQGAHAGEGSPASRAVLRLLVPAAMGTLHQSDSHTSDQALASAAVCHRRWVRSSLPSWLWGVLSDHRR